MTSPWEPIDREATEYLQQLVRIDTSNPPGNEIAAVRFLEGLLRREGLQPVIIEPAPGRANLVCRYGTGGTEGPLLLTSHVDVVPAESAGWTHPPFGGVLADGYLWGRGTCDMKSMTIMALMTILRAKREGLVCRRDLIFAAVADEECETRYGSAYLVEHHPELIRAEYALNEMGGFTLHVGSHRLYPIQVAEKGLLWLRVRLRGIGGHGSVPHDRMVADRMARVVRRLRRHGCGYGRTPVATAFLQALSRAHTGLRKYLLQGLTVPLLGRALLPLLRGPYRAHILAQLHNTVAPTVMASGTPTSINVIPTSGELYLDCRLLPGESRGDFLAALQRTLGNDAEIDVLRYRTSTEQPCDTPVFHVIAQGIRQADPGAQVAPMMLNGFTDAHFYRKLGIITYGFQPVQCPSDFSFPAMPHAVNERIPIAGFHWGVKTFYDIVRRIAT
ncbi:MAG: M20/M25/M40 family metallo-hydrolase [Deltaproteobacteria bacterium]|nr:M20/M25/M40 family metallo-hydrolase [Deltaproteobacteria bacterium]